MQYKRKGGSCRNLASLRITPAPTEPSPLGACRFEVHHVDHDYRNNLPTNLRPLCKPCHARAGVT
jgi:hypothetical protein